MYHQKRMKNGLTLLTVPISGTLATTVLVMVPVGSRYEHRKISGASHFVEHLMFKGTAKRPTSVDISRALDAVGAEYNAFTAKDYTGYYVKINSEREELAFDVLSDMLFASRLDAEEIKKEKGVIVEELRMYEDNPGMAINLLFDRLLFGDCPLGWDEGGDIETVRSMSREDLWNYYRSAYRPDNMVLVVAGKVEKNRIEKLVNTYFVQAMEKSSPYGRFPAGKKNINKNDFEKFIWNAPLPLPERIVVKKKAVDQAHVILGFPGLSHDDPRRFTASVLLNILGGGMSSRLFVEVREKRGLAYMVHAGAYGFRDTGAVFIRSGLDPARLPEALKVIREELNKIKKEKVTAKELKDAEENLAGHTVLSMEESNAQANWYAHQFWFAKEMETPEEVIAKIRRVKASDVQKLAGQLFDEEKMRLAVIGPMEKNDVEKMLK